MEKVKKISPKTKIENGCCGLCKKWFHAECAVLEEDTLTKVINKGNGMDFWLMLVNEQLVRKNNEQCNSNMDPEVLSTEIRYRHSTAT